MKRHGLIGVGGKNAEAVGPGAVVEAGGGPITREVGAVGAEFPEEVGVVENDVGLGQGAGRPKEENSDQKQPFCRCGKSCGEGHRQGF